MFSYLSSFMYGSQVQVSPVVELGQAIQGKYASVLTSSEENRDVTSKITKLRQTIGKIKNAEGMSQTGFRGQVEIAKTLNKQKHSEREKDLASLSGHNLIIMKQLEKDIVQSGNEAFDESLDFIRKNFELITQAQSLSTDNTEAYNKDLETVRNGIGNEVANSVNDFVQLNLKAVKKETLDSDYNKTNKDLANEFVLIKTDSSAERVAYLVDDFEFIDAEEKEDPIAATLAKLIAGDENILIDNEEFVLIQGEDEELLPSLNGNC